MTAPRYTPLQRQIAAAKMTLDAKLVEYPAHLLRRDQAAEERCRTEASAALESYLDLTREMMIAEVGR